jgi:hypothetical protein
MQLTAQAAHCVWNILDWLQLWEWNDRYEGAEEFAASPSQDLSMHL